MNRLQKLIAILFTQSVHKGARFILTIFEYYIHEVVALIQQEASINLKYDSIFLDNLSVTGFPRPVEIRH